METAYSETKQLCMSCKNVIMNMKTLNIRRVDNKQLRGVVKTGSCKTIQKAEELNVNHRTVVEHLHQIIIPNLFDK